MCENAAGEEGIELSSDKLWQAASTVGFDVRQEGFEVLPEPIGRGWFLRGAAAHNGMDLLSARPWSAERMTRSSSRLRLAHDVDRRSTLCLDGLLSQS